MGVSFLLGRKFNELFYYRELEFKGGVNGLEKGREICLVIIVCIESLKFICWDKERVVFGNGWFFCILLLKGKFEFMNL